MSFVRIDQNKDCYHFQCCICGVNWYPNDPAPHVKIKPTFKYLQHSHSENAICMTCADNIVDLIVGQYDSFESYDAQKILTRIKE